MLLIPAIVLAVLAHITPSLACCGYFNTDEYKLQKHVIYGTDARASAQCKSILSGLDLSGCQPTVYALQWYCARNCPVECGAPPTGIGCTVLNIDQAPDTFQLQCFCITPAANCPSSPFVWSSVERAYNASCINGAVLLPEPTQIVIIETVVVTQASTTRTQTTEAVTGTIPNFTGTETSVTPGTGTETSVTTGTGSATFTEAGSSTEPGTGTPNFGETIASTDAGVVETLPPETSTIPLGEESTTEEQTTSPLPARDVPFRRKIIEVHAIGTQPKHEKEPASKSTSSSILANTIKASTTKTTHTKLLNNNKHH